MCKSKADGGRRCAAHTRPAYTMVLTRYREDPSYELGDDDFRRVSDFATTIAGAVQIEKDIREAHAEREEDLTNFLITAFRDGLARGLEMSDESRRRTRDRAATRKGMLSGAAGTGQLRRSETAIKMCTACRRPLGPRAHKVGKTARLNICHSCWLSGVATGESALPCEPREYPGHNEVAREFVSLITEAVTASTSNGKQFANGDKALENLTRSQWMIKKFHYRVADMLVAAGADANLIRYEARLRTHTQGKNADIALYDASDDFWSSEKTVAVVCKSQVSSSGRNHRNNYNSVRGDAIDFHEQFPKQVVGQAQIMMLYEVDREAARRGELVWIPTPNVARTLSWYHGINNREGLKDKDQKFERLGVLIIDPRDGGRAVSNITELIESGTVTQDDVDDYQLTLDGITMDGFAQDLLRIHKERFGSAD